MSTAPLMPKATAVWLVENTALSFDQIAAFCKLHPLEVKAIADGEAAQGIKGLDPIMAGQLSPRRATCFMADAKAPGGADRGGGRRSMVVCKVMPMPLPPRYARILGSSAM